MVKIRAFISKKSVPRGIDINNKEYWQPFAVTIKHKGNSDDSGNGSGDEGDGGDGGDSGDNTKCNITVITTPADATINAIDSNGNSYTNKTFSVNKGSEVTIVATPSSPSTGYKQTTKTITSEETNQNSLVFNITLDQENTDDTKTTVTILGNIAHSILEVYDSSNNRLNSNNNNIINNVDINSVIKIKIYKENYRVTASTSGLIVQNGDNYWINNIVVTKNLTVTITYEQVENATPAIRLSTNEFLAYSNAYENYIRTFEADYHKIRIYGDLPISFSDGDNNSVADSLGGQSITRNDVSGNVTKTITWRISLTQNNGETRRYNFTIVAENKNNIKVSKSFVVVQYAADTIYNKASIVTKINGVVSNISNIIREINGESVNNQQEVDVPKDSAVTFRAVYLGKEFADIEIATSNIQKVYDFPVVNIRLGVVNINTAQFTLQFKESGEQINNWDGTNIPVIRNTVFRLTGIDTNNEYSPYDSGWISADGNAIDVDFTLIPKQKYTIRIKTYVEEELSDVPKVYMAKNNGAAVEGRVQEFEAGDNITITSTHEGYSTKTLQINNIDKNREEEFHFLNTVANHTVIINTIPSDAIVRLNGIETKQATFNDGSKVTIVVEKEGYQRYESTIQEIHNDYETTIELNPIVASTATVTVRTYVNGVLSQEPIVHIRLDNESNSSSNLGRTRTLPLHSVVICEAEYTGFNNQTFTINDLTQNDIIDLRFAAEPANCDVNVVTYIDGEESNTPVVTINAVEGRYQSIRRGDQVDITAVLNGYNVSSAVINNVVVSYPITINSLNENKEVKIYFVTQTPVEYRFSVTPTPSDAVVTIYDDTNNQSYVQQNKMLPAGVSAYAKIEKEGYITQYRPTNAMNQESPGRVTMDQNRDYNVVLVKESNPQSTYRVKVIPKVDGRRYRNSDNITITINGGGSTQYDDVTMHTENYPYVYLDLPAGTTNVKVRVTYNGDRITRVIPILNSDITIDDIEFSSDGDNETNVITTILCSLNGVTTSDEAKQIQIVATDLNTQQVLPQVQVGGTRVKRIEVNSISGHTIQIVASLTGYTDAVYKIKPPISRWLVANITGDAPSEDVVKVSLNENGPFGAQVTVNIDSDGDDKLIYIQSNMDWEISE